MALLHIEARPGESLTDHTLAVVAQVERLARLRPGFDDLYWRLRLAAWLHDSGKLAPGFQRQFKGERWRLRHEVLSLACLDWSQEADIQVAAAVATHHRDLDFILDEYRPQSGQVERLFHDLDGGDVREWYDWLVAQGVRLYRFSQLTPDSVYRWLADLDGLQITDATLLRGSMLQADHAAAAQAPDYGPVRLRDVTPARSYDHQMACAGQSGQSLLLVAPTGSGKTEAALGWVGECPRLFYLLPYRASMNAMLYRLEGHTDHVGLQHGRALSVLYHQLDDLTEARQRMNLARLFAYPVRVFSPYHLLQAVYRFKGYEAELTDCQGARIVVDEIHAYEPDRLAKILATLRFLVDRFDVRVLVMTATLAGVVRQAIGDTLGDLSLVQAAAGAPRHRLHLYAGDLLDDLPRIAAEERAALVVVNTVKRAGEVARRLRESGREVILIHGRFNSRDRWRLEQEIMRLFHDRKERQVSPPLVVATQVIEVSLDLDFDTLYSDPAPLDALVQRFGRVNRRGLLPELAPVQVYTEPVTVYDPTLVAATSDLLAEYDGQPVEEDAVGGWLDRVYAASTDWQERFQMHLTDFEQGVLADYRPFESGHPALVAAFRELFDECAVLPLDLEDAYRTAENPVEAAGWLVSISWWQYRMLERQGRAWQEDDLYMVDASYDPAIGLQLYEEDTSCL